MNETADRAATKARRPIRARGAAWSVAIARWLTKRDVSPNAVSVASVVFAVIGGLALGFSGRVPLVWSVVLLTSGPIWVGLRSLCNMLDGMIAVEGGKQTPSGIVYNEFPDRISDVAFFVGAGYGAGLPGAVTLGWCAAMLAVGVAFVRVMGASCGVGHDFSGPMAKPHRMATLAIASAAAAIERLAFGTAASLLVGLLVIAFGSVITMVLRLRTLVRTLEERPA